MTRAALLVTLLLLPATAVAQIGPGGRRPNRGFDEEPADTLPSNATRGFQFGVTSYTGGWVPSALEAGLNFRTGGPFSTVGLAVRLGSFIQNNAVLFGRTQGFFVGLMGTARRPVADLWMVGSENNPTPQGGFGVLVAPLLGISIGGRGAMNQNFLIAAGPAWFGPKASEWHVQVSLRFAAPLGGRDARTPPPN
jgi:hypothetical protein